jgi:N-formylglutamate deformylase
MIKSFVELQDENEPVLALAIHNGHEMNPDLLKICGISEGDRLREEDPYTENFACAFPNKMIVYTSRFSVDLNRKREHAVYQSPEDCWGLPARVAPVSDELMTQLLRDYGQWYSIMTFTIQRMLEKHPFLLILDLHSYNHRRQGAEAPADPQDDNPDIILGRNNMPPKYYAWVEKLRGELNRKPVGDYDLDCRIDVKFTGGWMSRWLHQTFPGQVLCLAVEFKKIFMDEWTGDLDKTLQDKLAKLFCQAVEKCKGDLFTK